MSREEKIPENGLDVFRRSEWIGRGLKFRIEDLPAAVEQEWTEILRIPLLSKYNYAIMNPQLSVHALLASNLPTTVENSKVIVLAEDCFRQDEPPRHLPVDFEKRPIPPLSFVQNLRAAAGQAWLDG